MWRSRLQLHISKRTDNKHIYVYMHLMLFHHIFILSQFTLLLPQKMVSYIFLNIHSMGKLSQKCFFSLWSTVLIYSYLSVQALLTDTLFLWEGGPLKERWLTIPYLHPGLTFNELILQSSFLESWLVITVRHSGLVGSMLGSSQEVWV